MLSPVFRCLAWLAHLLGLYPAGILLTTIATWLFLWWQPRWPQPLQRWGPWACWLPLAAAAALMTYGGVQGLSVYVLLQLQDALSDAQSWRLLSGMLRGWGLGLMWGVLATLGLRGWYVRYRSSAQAAGTPELSPAAASRELAD